MKGALFALTGALMLAAGLAPSAQAEKPLPDRSASIPQLVREPSLSARSSAALDQISAVNAQTRGAVEQIDPSARAIAGADAEPPPASTEVLTAGASAGTGAPPACRLTPDQAAILQSLQMQAQVISDGCELIEWLAVTGAGRPVAEARRQEGEAVSALMPELLPAGAAPEADPRAAEEEAAREALREIIVLPGQTADFSGGP